MFPTDFYKKSETYQKAEVDTLITSLNDMIIALTARVKALEDKGKSTNPELTDDGNLVLQNAGVSSEGNLDLENKATLDDDGSLKL